MVATLHCRIRNYAWGSQGVLSELVESLVDDLASPGAPEAELWMGAHPGAPSLLDDGRSLVEAIAADPEGQLGSEVAATHGALPFLFKVLAVEQPLSIQAHPSPEQARAGFAAENARGIPLDAPNRNYRDPNHKPELIAAMTRFEGKCGFRPLEASRRLFRALAEGDPRGAVLAPVVECLHRPGDPAGVLATTLELVLGSDWGDGPAAATVLPSLAGAVLAEGGPLSQAFGPDLGACDRIAAAFPGDVGAVVALLLNHVVLEPGEALFLGPGNLHAYLSGLGIEIMANSDNVLRGGLTPKHVDVAALLAVVDCTPVVPQVQRPSGARHTYHSPVGEFSLTRVANTQAAVAGPAIVLVTEGEATLGARRIGRGQPQFVAAADGSLSLVCDGLAWVAGVGASLARS